MCLQRFVWQSLKSKNCPTLNLWTFKFQNLLKWAVFLIFTEFFFWFVEFCDNIFNIQFIYINFLVAESYHTEFRTEIPILGSEAYVHLKVNLFLLLKNFWSMNIYHDYTDFETQISFLGFVGLFLYFWSPKACIIFFYTKFPIDWWVTWPISFLNPLLSLGIQLIPNREKSKSW
jgi:hypothetical protein